MADAQGAKNRHIYFSNIARLSLIDDIDGGDKEQDLYRWYNMEYMNN